MQREHSVLTLRETPEQLHSYNRQRPQVNCTTATLFSSVFFTETNKNVTTPAIITLYTIGLPLLQFYPAELKLSYVGAHNPPFIKYIPRF